MLRLVSLAVFFATWLIGSALAGEQMLLRYDEGDAEPVTLLWMLPE